MAVAARPPRVMLSIRHTGSILAILFPQLTEAEVAAPKPLITRSDSVMSGAVLFAGTRVPVQTFLDYLEDGDTLDEFRVRCTG